MKDAGEFAGAHVLSTVHAHYPLVDMSQLESAYPEEVGPKEADELRVSLLDLLSTVVSDNNLCETSTPPNQPGLDRSARELSGALIVGDGRSMPAVSTSQAPVAPTFSTAPGAHAGEQPEQ